MSIKEFIESETAAVFAGGTRWAIRRLPALALLSALAFSAVSCGGGGGSSASGSGVGSAGGGSSGGSGSNPPTVGSTPPAPSSAAVSLAWDAPAQSSDGTALTDLAGYKIYDGSSAGTYTMVTDVGEVTAYTTEPLPAGTYFFTVTAYDTSGNESDLSNEVVATVADNAAVQVLAIR